MRKESKIVRETAAAMLPREKLLSGTTAAELTDQELLATLLKTGTKDCNVLELAGKILKEFGSLYDLSIADWRELKEVHGLGTVRSLELYSMFEFGRRAIRRPIADFQKTPLDSAAKVAMLLKPYVLGERQETFYVIFLDAKGYLMCEPKAMTKGTRKEALVGVPEVIREAIRRDAASIIVAHNHPNASSDPSLEDIALTERLVEACRTVEIELKDHLILGGKTDGDDWSSLRASGLVNFEKRA